MLIRSVPPVHGIVHGIYYDTIDLDVAGVTLGPRRSLRRAGRSAARSAISTGAGARRGVRASAIAARSTCPAGPPADWVAGAVAELESILEQADKPAVYAGLLHAADARPPAHGALVAMTQERGSAIRNQLLFFDLEWIAVDDGGAQRRSSTRRPARATAITSQRCAAIGRTR